jgi:hypothetical protein
LAIPSTNSVVHGYRMAMTPDRLLGRVESIWRTISLLLTPLGPLVAWGNLSPSIRAAPSLDELDRHRG